MTSSPLISVIMSIYNGDEFLRKAVESILNQSYGHLEFIIINDGSTDDTGRILASYRDKRIHVLTNTQNIGLARSLNKGLSVARGKYIARMDADDVCVSHRLEKQVKFLENHPETAVLGSFSSNPDSTQIKTNPVCHDDIVISMLRFNPIIHPSVMFRRKEFERLQLRYNESYNTAQDYDLWVQAFLKGMKFHNLPEPLIAYRHHDRQLTVKKGKQQQGYSKEVQMQLIDRWGLDEKKKELFQILILNPGNIQHQDQYMEAKKFLYDLWNLNFGKPLFDKSKFKSFLVSRWFKVLENAERYDPFHIPLLIFFKKPFVDISFKASMLKYWLYCLTFHSKEIH